MLKLFDAGGDVVKSIYRMFPRVVNRVRVILDSGVAGLPRRRLGGAGGPAAPVRGVRGDTLPGVYRVIYGDVWTLVVPPQLGGLGGGPHKVLLDLLVRTDTKGGSRGSKGDPLVPIRCDVCGLPIRFCRCLAGEDY